VDCGVGRDVRGGAQVKASRGGVDEVVSVVIEPEARRVKGEMDQADPDLDLLRAWIERNRAA
jgi:hypothetical protein